MSIITFLPLLCKVRTKLFCVCSCISSRDLGVFHHFDWVTHSNRSRRRICKRLMKQEMQNSLVFWLRFDVCEALHAASWTLSRSPKLSVCEGEINFQLLSPSLSWEERGWKTACRSLAVSMPCHCLSKQEVQLCFLHTARGACRFALSNANQSIIIWIQIRPA